MLEQLRKSKTDVDAVAAKNVGNEEVKNGESGKLTDTELTLKEQEYSLESLYSNNKALFDKLSS